MRRRRRTNGRSRIRAGRWTRRSILANLYYARRQYAEAIRLYREATATLDGVPPEQFAPEPYS